MGAVAVVAAAAAVKPAARHSVIPCHSRMKSVSLKSRSTGADALVRGSTGGDRIMNEIWLLR